jgi:hypothetical protein
MEGTMSFAMWLELQLGFDSMAVLFTTEPANSQLRLGFVRTSRQVTL